MQHTKQKGAILRLIGTVRDADGRIVSTFTKDNDIYLWNWAVIVAQFLKVNFCPTDPTTYGYKNVSGADAATTAGYYGASGWWIDYMNANWKVQIGGGNIAPAVTDFSLVSGLQEVTPTLPEIITAGSILKVACSSTFAFAAQTVVSETAIKANGLIMGINESNPYIITRDVFTAQTVPAGGSITIQHELWFNGTPPAA